MTSKLEELIAELCPNGVEYKKIGDIKKDKAIRLISPSLKIKSNDYKNEGSVPIISQELEFISGYSDVFDPNIPNSEYVCFGDHSEHIKYVNFAFAQGADGLKIISVNNEVMLAKYFYYAISNYYVKHNNYERHFKYLIDTEIPVPPLEVQAEIVRILDTFTELTAELTAELTDRKKQYEYYRDTLLTFNDNNPLHSLIQRYCPNGVEYKALEYVASYSKNRIDSQILDEHNYVGVENLLQNKQGKTLANSIPKESKAICFSIGDVLIGNIRPYLKKIWFADCVGGTNGDVLVIHIHDKNVISPRFLYHILSSERFFLYDVRNSKGAKMPRGDKKAVMQFEIPVPPLEVQHQIVQILDRFDALCNDLTQGLPAEIEARRKQYEYYRDLLLTFKRA